MKFIVYRDRSYSEKIGQVRYAYIEPENTIEKFDGGFRIKKPSKIVTEIFYDEDMIQTGVDTWQEASEICYRLNEILRIMAQ